MQKKSGRVFTSIVLTGLFIFTFSIFTFAQDLDNVTIRGQITDSNNAPIVGATVAAKLSSTGVERTVVTDDEGRFNLVKLEPGTYTVKFSAQGFGAKEQKDLVTIAGQNIQLNISLAPAGVTAEQTITIDGDDAPPVDTTRTVVGGTITSKEIEEIPVNSRNPLDLVLTLGGTSEEALSTRDLAEDRNQNPATAPAEQGNFSLSGGASYSNNITIDGLDNNDDRGANVRFQPSLEAIEEVQVITNQFSAEYGRASGGRINFRTRSGSNKFRGRVFMFFRDDNLNANTWYNNSRGFARLPLTEYNPGFTFSGPIFKNKTFFSIAYEYNNLKDTTFIDTFVPAGTNPKYTLPAGNTPCPANAIGGCFDNSSATPTAIASYTNLTDTPSVTHIFTAKIDHRLTSNNDFTFGWQLGRKNNRRTVGTSTTRLDEALQARNSDTDAYNFTDNHVFGANAVNQFRMQYSKFEPSYQTDNPFDPVVLIGYRNPITASGQTLIAGNSTSSIFGDATGFPQNRQETRWQFQDSLTYVAGNHTLKGGFDLQTVRSKATGLGDATGTFNFLNVLNYQQNILSRYRQNFGTASDVTNNYWGIFFNDESRIGSNLTLSAGLRYERETAVKDNNNFGPRIGIAYSPWKDGKGVVRFGAGIFYNRVLLRTVADSIQNNVGIVPFDSNFIGSSASDASDPRRIAILAAIANRFPNTFPTQAELQTLVASTCATIVTTFTCNNGTGFQLNQGSAGNPLRSVDANLEIPHSSQFNLGFEREIGKSFVFEANYTWNRTDNLWRDRNINAPVLPAGFSTWTDYLLATPFTFTNANNTVRTYRFYLGTNLASNATTAQNGSTTCANSTTVTCFVNLNSVSTSTTVPTTAVTGASTNNIGSPIGIALAAIARFRPDPNFEEKSRIGSIGRAMYEGLILEVRRRFRPLGWGFGASFRAVYTHSSTMDDGLNNTSNAEINGDFNAEFARSLQDRRHRFSLTGTFETPFWLGKLRFSPLFRYGSSAPFSLGNGGVDRNLDDLSNDRLNFSGNVKDIVWREPGSTFPATLASQFTLQPIGAISGNLGRNAGIGPSLYLFDLGLSRDFKITERMRLKPTIQFDNIFNAAVFNYGAGFIDFDALSPNASATTISNFQNAFLVPTRTYRPRQIRIGLRFDF